MTALIPEYVRRSIESFTFDYRSTTSGIVLIGVLIAFLLAREVVRAHGGVRATERVDALNAFVYPMLLAFAAVVVVRLVSLF